MFPARMVPHAEAKHIDVARLMKITGHATVESVLRYIQTRDEDISETMHALELRGSAPPNQIAALHENCTDAENRQLDEPELPLA